MRAPPERCPCPRASLSLSLPYNQLHLWSDKWTAVTVDGGRCAQAEHTVLITEDGPEILTQV